MSRSNLITNEDSLHSIIMAALEMTVTEQTKKGIHLD